MKTLILVKSYYSCIHTHFALQIPIKKGLTSLDACKPLIILVGDTGFEPVTSTV